MRTIATVNYIKEKSQNPSGMKGVIDYCVQDAKVFNKDAGYRLVSGINCDGENAFNEFITTKQAYRKADGIFFYQYTQSFSPEEHITPEQAHMIARGFAEKAWPQHEILVATHCDAAHIHSHFVINSVSFETGMKLRQHPDTLIGLRKLSDEICAQHGLSLLKEYENSGAKLSTREYRSAEKHQSWKIKLMTEINKAMDMSGSRRDFILEMQRRGYQVNWKDDRKYITFTCPGGMKCRDIKLHYDKYRKENIQNELQIRESGTVQLRTGQACGEQYSGDGYDGDSPISADSIRRAGGYPGCGNESSARGGRISAEAVRVDRGTRDEERDRGLLFRTGEETRIPERGDSGCGREQNRFRGEHIDLGEPENGQVNAGLPVTGWEGSRRIYLENISRIYAAAARIERRNRALQAERKEISAAYRDSDNSFVAAGVHSLLEAGSLIESEPENEEERRKRIEAQNNSQTVGAVIGLAAAVALLTEKENDVTIEQDMQEL